MLEGSLRAFQDEVYDGLRDGLYAIATEVEREFGCRVEISLSQGYPAAVSYTHLTLPTMAVV